MVSKIKMAVYGANILHFRYQPELVKAFVKFYHLLYNIDAYFCAVALLKTKLIRAVSRNVSHVNNIYFLTDKTLKLYMRVSSGILSMGRVGQIGRGCRPVKGHSRMVIGFWDPRGLSNEEASSFERGISAGPLHSPSGIEGQLASLHSPSGIMKLYIDQP